MTAWGTSMGTAGHGENDRKNGNSQGGVGERGTSRRAGLGPACFRAERRRLLQGGAAVVSERGRNLWRGGAGPFILTDLVTTPHEGWDGIDR